MSRAALAVLMIVFSAIGLGAAIEVYSSYYVAHRAPLYCSYEGKSTGIKVNCLDVLSSPYSKVYYVSLDELAIAWFSADLAISAALCLGPPQLSRAARLASLAWRSIGIAVVPYLIYLELFRIHAICVYCTTMHIMIAADFAVIVYEVASRSSSLNSILRGR